MATFKTPGVYVQEVPSFPPSVAAVSTAIPAFLGYTEVQPREIVSFAETIEVVDVDTGLSTTLVLERQLDEGVTLLDFTISGPSGIVVEGFDVLANTITVSAPALTPGDDVSVTYPTLALTVSRRISNFLEYQSLFGDVETLGFDVTIVTDANGIRQIKRTTATTLLHRMMYPALDMYFKNGGGPCWIVSIGTYDDALDREHFENGLAALEKEDEPTLIVNVDAINLEAADYYTVGQASLAQCNKLQDRFCIFDLLATDTDGSSFRNGIGINYLNYGAAYTPWLQTVLNAPYDTADVNVIGVSLTTSVNGLVVGYASTAEDPTVIIEIPGSPPATTEFAIAGSVLTITLTGATAATAIVTEWDVWAASNDASGFSLTAAGDGTDTVAATAPAGELVSSLLSDFEATNTALYNNVIAELDRQRITLPPSSSVAGIYAATDRDNGVWRAPANRSLNAVVAPTLKITSEDQENLNVDATGGKSINAIRAFQGKGTLVWGARTLAGNDNEWRYINVRRLFIFVEESVRKATEFVVFEPNDAVSWIKVKGLVDNFLRNLWQQGALAGTTPDQAYYVNIGLGKTMTPQDILEGRMIVEIGMAAVRPAEFIILKFSHKLQEA